MEKFSNRKFIIRLQSHFRLFQNAVVLFHQRLCLVQRKHFPHKAINLVLSNKESESTNIAYPLFLVIYMYIFQKGTMEIIGSPFKGGYWFTLILFAYFCMYSIGDYLLSVLRFNTKQRLMVLFATSLIIYVLCTNPVLIGGRMAHILSLSQFRYFCFFVFGTIVKFQYDKVKDLFKIIMCQPRLY